MISRIAKIDNTKKGTLKYAAYRLWNMKTSLIILAICGVVSYPLLALTMVILDNDRYSMHGGAGGDFFVVISILLAVVAAVVVGLMTYSGGVNSYDYFNRREKVDLSWSLPITGKQRFWGDFAAGFLPIGVVYTGSAGLGLLILRLGLDERALSGDLFTMAAACMLAGLLFLAALYIVGVFCAALCGRFFESVIYPALICGIIPALIGLFGVMIFMNVWQVQIYQQINTVFAATSPFGFLVVFIHTLTSGMRFITETAPITDSIIFLRPAVIIPFVLVHGGFLTAAYYMSKKRGAESTGKPFAFKVAGEVIITLVVFCFVAVFCYIAASDAGNISGAIFGMVASSAIAFLMLDVSAKRGFRKMGRAFVRYAIMFTGSLIISNIILAADGFGIGTYIPESGRIKSVSINMRHMDDLGIFNHYAYSSLPPQAQFTDPEIIALVHELHKASNDNPHNNNTRITSMWDTGSYYEDRYWDSYYRDFHGRHDSGWHWNEYSVTYTLKSGRTVTRRIRLNDAENVQLLCLVTDGDYKQNNLDSIDGWLDGVNERNLEYRATVHSFSQDSSIFMSGRSVDGARIYEAFRKDYMAETFNQRFRSTEAPLGRLYFDFVEMGVSIDGRTPTFAGELNIRIYVFTHYTNLIAELERQGLDVWNGKSDSTFTPHFSIIRAGYIAGNISTAQNVQNNWYGVQRGMLTEENREILDVLLSVAQPSHLVDDAGYFLSVSGMSYVIPPEFNHLAERFAEIVGEQPYYTEIIVDEDGNIMQRRWYNDGRYEDVPFEYAEYFHDWNDYDDWYDYDGDMQNPVPLTALDFSAVMW
jgi:hypothetical protein